ncbi:MAG: cytochrome c3 family protein [Slackia piriformis]|uniref:Cytochrome c3 family protein n=1 Tax=Slackia piriformis TaxID=626934 RepID=A0A943Z6V2_9ACTN|nr:cytochrome c3 family protein [Slackia piriformis]
MTEQEKRDAQAGQDAAPHAAKKVVRKNRWIAVGVVAAVLVLAGAGFWVWHEQPSFCNAVCHSPMDKYVETYYEGDPGKLVTAHAAQGDACLDCHEAEITTQVSEVMAWVSDDYPMGEDGLLATGKEFATEEFCTNGGCHAMTDVVDATWGFAGNDEKYNPHSSHQDNNLECGDCHRVHETSTLYCAKCHDMNLPEGWEATGE